MTKKISNGHREEPLEITERDIGRKVLTASGREGTIVAFGDITEVAKSFNTGAVFHPDYKVLVRWDYTSSDTVDFTLTTSKQQVFEYSTFTVNGRYLRADYYGKAEDNDNNIVKISARRQTNSVVLPEFRWEVGDTDQYYTKSGKIATIMHERTTLINGFRYYQLFVDIDGNKNSYTNLGKYWFDRDYDEYDLTTDKVVPNLVEPVSEDDPVMYDTNTEEYKIVTRLGYIEFVYADDVIFKRSEQTWNFVLKGVIQLMIPAGEIVYWEVNH